MGYMLLAIDIGNTSINSGIFKDSILKRRFSIPTYAPRMRDEYVGKLGVGLKQIEKVIVVSVVPKVLNRVEEVLRKVIGRNILVVGRDVESGVRNLYRKPEQVGQDRLVNARAAYELYGGESVIVDFGTAITIDIVNRHKEYLGGVIAPGVEISLDALSERAVLLPKVRIEKPDQILGRETRQSMISGAVYGFSSLCDGIVKRLKTGHCRKARVIATGGMARIIGPFCETVDIIDPDLTLKGLMLINRAGEDV